MDQTKYNGWTNYETWVVALWIDNEEASYRHWLEKAQEHWDAAPDDSRVTRGFFTRPEAARERLAETLKTALTEAAPVIPASCWADLLGAALAEVNWYEIAEHLLSGIVQETE